MTGVALRSARPDDRERVVGFSESLDPVAYAQLARDDRLARAIADGECYLIAEAGAAVGFLLLDHRFFGRGWVDLIVVGEGSARRGTRTPAR